MTEQMEAGKWYAVEEPGYVCANGNPYRGSIRKGTENKLIVYFDGGGVSWSEYTAARPASEVGFFGSPFYFDWIFPLEDLYNRNGILSHAEWNYFSNWSMVNIHYTTGDFHTGTGEFPYVAKNGENKILYHHGYRNFSMVMDAAQEQFPNPDQILIAGISAGAFGVAALSDAVIQRFPNCPDITCCADSGFLKGEWGRIAREVWKTPSEIRKNMHENIVPDCMLALHEKYGDRIRYLALSSTRDAILAWYRNILRDGSEENTKEGGEIYQQELKEACFLLKKGIPGMGFYIFDEPAVGVDSNLNLTRHTILEDPAANEPMGGNISALEWLVNCVKGKVESIGFELLER